MKSLVSIILRAKNEEFWVGRLMEALHAQNSCYSFEVVLVDNCSTDETVAKVRALCEQLKVVTIEKYIPGAALNRGLEAADGDYVVSISAHCVPADNIWLERLIAPLSDQSVVAVYGRQVPLLTSDPKDKRDLWLTFGLDDKVQSRDPFLHNANAAYRRADLLEHPFSEVMTNIEDRSWAIHELKNGRKIYYAANAVVYHDHGIHQAGCHDRLSGVINMMNDLHGEFDRFNDYYGAKAGLVSPSTCLIVPISDRYGDEDLRMLEKNADEIKANFCDWTIYLMPSCFDHMGRIRELGFSTINFRLDSPDGSSNPLVVDISQAVKYLTDYSEFYDFVATFDIRKWIPSRDFIEKTLTKVQSDQADAAIAAVHKPSPTFFSGSGEKLQMEYSGWLNWLDGFEITNVPVLDPSRFLLAKMDVFRKGNPLQFKFCQVMLDD